MGYPFGYDFTEAIFYGISENFDEKSVSLSFFLMDGTNVGIFAKDVRRLLLTDFLEQNIVDELSIYNDLTDMGVLRDCISTLVTANSDVSEIAAYDGLIDILVDKILNKELQLLEMSPVYGARVLLLAGALEGTDARVGDVGVADAGVEKTPGSGLTFQHVQSIQT